MRLRWVGKAIWEVLAIADDANKTVVDELRAMTAEYHHAESMRAMIQNLVPMDGPPWFNKQQCRTLWDDILEFKAGPRRGKQLRVLWFYDAGNPVVRKRVICTPVCFFKREDTSVQDVKRAKILRAAYMVAKSAGTLEIEPREENKENGSTGR